MTRKQSSRHRFIQSLRICCQLFFFGLFFYLLLGTHYSGQDYIGAVERFFHFDPLIGLAASIGGRILLTAFLWALITVIITVIFGRFICGWVCPFGGLLQAVSFVFKKSKFLVPKDKGYRLLFLKYSVLVLIITASLFALDLTGYMDPLALLYRSFITVVLPAVSITTNAVISALGNAGLTSAAGSASEVFQNLTINSIFHQGLFLGVLFLGVLFLNKYRERFWCRYLCPAGALLAFLSRYNLVKLSVDETKCTDCGYCTLHCPTQATPYPKGDWKPAECIYCYTCSSKCPTGAVTFPLRIGPVESPPVDFSRRKWIFSSLIGAVAVPLFRISSQDDRVSEKLIRPPGSQPEAQFLALCIKCGECMKVCPTNALQPALNQAGPEGFWTPVLVPQVGYCEYYCSLCTQVCPTGAIRELKIREKTKVRVGLAWINKNRCIPYVLGESCTVCQEQCPTSPNAIAMTEVEVTAVDGTLIVQKVPVVNIDVCIGCGICETKCPVYDEPGIYCTGIGESRSL